MGTLIKADVFDGLASVIPDVFKESCILEQFDIEDKSAEDIEKDYIEKAMTNAMAIKNAALAEVDELKNQAYKDGYQAGIESGLASVDPLIAKMQQDIIDLKTQKTTYFDSLEPEVLKLCLDIVEKVIRHEVKTDNKIVLRLIKMCLRRVKDRDQIEIRVNQSEVDAVKAKRDELLNLVEGVRILSITDDRRISPGGCVIESSAGTFDGRIETQIAKIGNELMETYDNGRRDSYTKPEQI